MVFQDVCFRKCSLTDVIDQEELEKKYKEISYGVSGDRLSLGNGPFLVQPINLFPRSSISCIPTANVLCCREEISTRTAASLENAKTYDLL